VTAEGVGFAGRVQGGGRGGGREDGVSLGGGRHVEAGGEGTGAGAGEEDGANGGVVGESGEDRGEVVPHSKYS